MTVFVLMTGDYPNIGDALIRRRALEWTADTRERRVLYAGDAPDAWIRQIAPKADDNILRGKRKLLNFYWGILTSPGRPTLVFEPGEVALGRGNAFREFGFLVMTVITRARRGIVLRPARAIHGPSRPSVTFHRLASRLSQHSLWREQSSLERMRTGMLVPDIAFATDIRAGLPWDARDAIVVSMRGKRPMPDETWFLALKRIAAKHGLTILTVTQVKPDEARSIELARRLDAQNEPWGDRLEEAQESLLREQYARAKLVVSDRLHVLILASLSGAVPAELAPTPSGKVASHLATVGLADMSLNSSDASVDEIVTFLECQLRRHNEVVWAVDAAHHELSRVRSTITLRSA